MPIEDHPLDWSEEDPHMEATKDATKALEEHTRTIRETLRLQRQRQRQELGPPSWHVATNHDLLFFTRLERLHRLLGWVE